MLNTRKFVDGAIASVFGAWLIATVLSQHPESSLDRIRRLDDRFGNTIIPNWKFFAPNPAVEDVHLLYRFASQDLSEHSPWAECHTISPRKPSQIFWFPRRRFEKGIFDAHQTLVVGMASLGKDERRNAVLRKAIEDTAKMLSNYIGSISNPESKWFWKQLMLVRFAGNDDTAKPIYDLILNYEVIEDRSVDIAPGFECDEYFGEHYDEVMRRVDPDVNHEEWLASAVKGRIPQRVLDIGAGAGRVVSGLAGKFPDAELIAIEPDKRFYQKLVDIDATVFSMPVEQVCAERAVKNIDLAYVTYGSLQYVSNKQELVDTLRAVRNLLKPGGVAAIEMFSSEIYHSAIQPGSLTLKLGGEPHTIGFSTLRYPNGMVSTTSRIERHCDGQTGTLRETFLPVSRLEAEEILRAAGYSSFEVELKGAYHRCMARYF